jgi:hypothetical protein
VAVAKRQLRGGLWLSPRRSRKMECEIRVRAAWGRLPTAALLGCPTLTAIADPLSSRQPAVVLSCESNRGRIKDAESANGNDQIPTGDQSVNENNPRAC